MVGLRHDTKGLDVGCLVGGSDPHDLLMLSLNQIPESARTARLQIRWDT